MKRGSSWPETFWASATACGFAVVEGACEACTALSWVKNPSFACGSEADEDAAGGIDEGFAGSDILVIPLKKAPDLELRALIGRERAVTALLSAAQRGCC